MDSEQQLYQKTDYQVLQKDEGYDVLHKGQVVRSFDDFGLAIANAASRVNKSESNIYVAPQADDPYLPAHECEPGTVFITAVSTQLI